mgnify:CR=1 FL=1
MKPQNQTLPSLIAVIDVGTHKTVGLVGQLIDGKARMLSYSERRTDGVVKGTVTDLEKLQRCVHEVVNDVERGAGLACPPASITPGWCARRAGNTSIGLMGCGPCFLIWQRTPMNFMILALIQRWRAYGKNCAKGFWPGSPP